MMSSRGGGKADVATEPALECSSRGWRTIRRHAIVLVCALAVLFVFSHETAWTQVLDRIAAFREQERKAIAEPFKGVTTDGKVVPGLFRISATGVSAAPVREAATALINGLTAEQRKKTLFSIT